MDLVSRAVRCLGLKHTDEAPAPPADASARLPPPYRPPENREDSSAGHQRLGHITRQGSSLLRFLLVEAAQAAARCDSDWRRRCTHLALRQWNIAKMATTRRLAVRMHWMWRNSWKYAEWDRFGSHARQLGTVEGVK